MIRLLFVCIALIGMSYGGHAVAGTGDAPQVGWTGTLTSIEACDTETHMRAYAHMYDYSKVDDPVDAFIKQIEMEEAGFCKEVPEATNVTVLSTEDLGAIDGIASFYLLHVEQEGVQTWMLFQELVSETHATAAAAPPPPFEGSWTGNVTNMWICLSKETWVELYDILDTEGLDALNAAIDSRGCTTLTTKNVTLSQLHYLGQYAFSNGLTDLWACHIEDQSGESAWALCDAPAATPAP